MRATEWPVPAGYAIIPCVRDAGALFPARALLIANAAAANAPLKNAAGRYVLPTPAAMLARRLLHRHRNIRMNRRHRLVIQIPISNVLRANQIVRLAKVLRKPRK